MKYLLDTNICIYLMKKNPLRVHDQFLMHRVGDVGLSSITFSELSFGVANSQRRDHNTQMLQEFVSPLEIFPYPAEAAPIYGQLRAELKKKGNLMGALDMLIAAHALYLEATLVTNNVAEFSRIPDLLIQNWI